MKQSKEKMLRKVVASSIIGATIEWYDFFLYGVMAGIVFDQLFFPTKSELISTILAFGTFAAGFVARPLGGVIFGHFGDNLGRKKMLIISLLIMGISTTLVAFLPTYASIGIAAPIILTVLRIVQGIALGGEWGGAILMAYEHAPKSKKGFYASLPQIGLAIGLLLSSGVVGLLSLVLSNEQFLTIGWRIAFGLSAFLILLGFWIRLNVDESPEFEELRRGNSHSRNPFKEMWKEHTPNILAGMGARYIDGVFFNVMGVFSITYLTETVGISRDFALMAVSLASFVMCFSIPLFGYLSDRHGRAKTYLIGSILTGISAIPSFWIMENSSSSIAILLAIAIPFGIIYASVYGPEAALFSELFEAKYRYTGISFVYQFSGIFAAGITPIIATYLLSLSDGYPIYLVLYVVVVSMISAGSASWIRNQSKMNKKESLPTTVNVEVE
ncbi:MFS transporter [Fervidibacillus albus]|uniref:Putative proline/betaine transporter n=1 Tax=Fervidibacillus albus TaxID=2980026 RepID=A0A9E8LT27_9BACI|nr:MFS transporter [Fervidibacillus albus]WAA09100.1 MHS family MFS transporter [Fervidibacillus albus]